MHAEKSSSEFMRTIKWNSLSTDFPGVSKPKGNKENAKLTTAKTRREKNTNKRKKKK